MNRIYLLVPFNAIILKGSIEYARNIRSISKKFWPNYLKFTSRTKTNLFMIASIQALIFSTVYVGGTFAVIGINPWQAFKDLQDRQAEEIRLLGQIEIDFSKPADEQLLRRDPSGKISTSNLLMFNMFRDLGLSDRTLLAIEKDLRD